MAHINHMAKQIKFKIVYYGPGLGGKTTNLQEIFKKIAPADRGKLVEMQGEGERTIFFDMVPINGNSVINGLNVRYALFTVPGQVYHKNTRKLVLKGADGIVFVADSNPKRLEANQEALQDLYDSLTELYNKDGTTPQAIPPIVLQYNKRDMPNALPEEVLDEVLNYDALPAFQAVAKESIGVFETLDEIAKLVETREKTRLSRK